MRLTKASVASLRLEQGRSELLVFDDAMPGFGLRIRAGGKRTWVIQYRLGDKQRRMTIGTPETLDAEEARKRAKGALAKVHLGLDPQLEKVENRAQASVTLATTVSKYLDRRAKPRLKPRSYEEVERHLNKHWAPLAETPIQKITRAQVATRLAEISARNGAFAANRARASLSGLFTWAIGEGLIDANPVAGTNKATEEIARDRVLTDDELKKIWAQTSEGEYGRVVRLLLLTGQRREEVGAMPWAELQMDQAMWCIGPGRTKNGLAHEVPLSAAALSILRQCEQREGRDLVFGRGGGGFQGWSKAKAALDERIKIEPWRLHDLRRTVATRLGDLGALPHVVEALLNHVSGSKAGVAGIYNRSAYSTEKKAALDMWTAHIQKLTGGKQ